MRKHRGTTACIAVGGSAIGLAVATTGPELTGCTTHQCDQSSYDWLPTLDGGPGGFMADKDTYMSNALNQTWLPYNGNTTIRVWFPPEVAGRMAEQPMVFTGTDDMPNSVAALDNGGNSAQAIGQLAIFNVLNVYPRNPADGGPEGPKVNGQPVGGGVEITNASCAQYFAQIVVHFLAEESAASSPAELPDAGTAVDGGTDGLD